MESWTRACKAAAESLTGLKELTLWIHANSTPVHLTLRETWLLPLLHFRRLAYRPDPQENADTAPSTLDRGGQGHGLDTVHISFRTYLSNNSSLGSGDLAKASDDLYRLFARAISLALLGACEGEAMHDFTCAWMGKYAHWQHHLGYASTGW
jgi:hypothetical protein